MSPEQLASKPKILFFHMGPGFHAGPERLQFSAQFPWVEFLDQPQEASFEELVLWGEKVIRDQEEGPPLILLGHSFGCHIISELIPSFGRKVCEVRFLNSAFDPFEHFVNLQNRLLPAKATSVGAWAEASVAQKMQLIFQVAGHSDLASCYWVRDQARNDYVRRASEMPALNVASFVHAFQQFLTLQRKLKQHQWPGRVEIFFSPQDSLLNGKASVAAWNQIFPKAEFHEFEQLGHYAHFESASLVQALFQA
jgi:pimeloyl-ACP methyl ester carboxylesterase